MSKVQTPQFLNDLYRDLRDRRLLIPAVALLVALVAVPVLISGGGSEPVATPAPSPLATGDATEVESAVLVEETGVRDYRKRLEALKSRNPFAQKFAAPTPESVALEEPAPSAVDTGASSAAPTDLPDVASSVPDSTSTSTPPEPVSTPPAGDSTGAEPPKPTRVVEQRFYSFRIDVAIGPLGEVKKVDDVRELDFLPSAKNSVVAFLGVDERGGKATFVLDADVLGSRGDGRCLGGGDAGVCQFLVLKAGEERIFDLGPGVPAQRLKLLDIHAVEVKAPKSQHRG